MSTNDKVGTTISGGGVNLISADAFVEIPQKISSWISLRVALLQT
jgi:hypothetical protein